MKVIKLYLSYFFTLTNIIIFSLLIIFLTFSYFMSIYDINESLSYDQVLASYFENSLYYSKIIIIFTTIFIFMKSYSERSAYVINFVLSSGYSKKINFNCLIVANLMIVYLFITTLFLSFLTIGFIMKPYFHLKLEYFISYFNMLNLAIYYGLLAYLFITLFNSQFVFLIPFLLNMISELLLTSDSIFSKIYLYFFPTIITSSGELSYNSVFCLFLSFILFTINKLLYIRKDLAN